MGTTQTTSRVLHDLGGAVWLGGSLMGAVGLNGASACVSDPFDRIPVASAGWARWAPVSGAAMGAHLLGGLGILMANRDRAAVKGDVRVNTIAKLALTAAATGATIWAGFLGGTLAAKLAEGGPVPAITGVVPDRGVFDGGSPGGALGGVNDGVVITVSGTAPAQSTPKDVMGVQQQLRALQWLIPSLMGVVLALSAQQGEQQAADAASATTQTRTRLRNVWRRAA